MHHRIRTRLLRGVSTGLALTGLAVAGTAQIVVIDFETPTGPTSFASTVAVTTEFAGQGLVFSGPAPGDGGAILDQGGNFGVNALSGTQFLAFNDNASTQTGIPRGPEAITFNTPASSASVWVSGGFGSTTFSLTAYSGGVQVGTPSVASAPANGWVELVFNNGQTFDSIAIDETGTDVSWVADDLKIEFGTPLNSFCSGDGSGTPCPCGNAGAAGEGCANSTGAGALLSGSGNATVGADTFALTVSQAPANRPGLFFQGTQQINAGAGVLFGDGLRCVGGPIVRLELVFTDAGGNAALSQPVTSLTPISVGDTRFYQFWYRDPVIGPCGQGFNLTNGIGATWQ